MDQVSITLCGSPSEIRDVLEYWISRDPPRIDRGTSDPQPPDLERFSHALTTDGRSVAAEIARVSLSKQRSIQADLISACGIKTDQELYGILGGIGKCWKQASGAANPFQGKWDSEKDEWFREIDPRLARAIYDALND